MVLGLASRDDFAHGVGWKREVFCCMEGGKVSLNSFEDLFA
jgi:hypothetical protein